LESQCNNGSKFGEGAIHRRPALAHPGHGEPGQQTVTEELKNSLRRRTIDREGAKNCISFPGQPMGRALQLKLREAYEAGAESKDDPGLLSAVATLAEQFGKERPAASGVKRLGRKDLELICFAYVSG